MTYLKVQLRYSVGESEKNHKNVGEICNPSRDINLVAVSPECRPQCILFRCAEMDLRDLGSVQ
jgi:hypothetical protein